MCKKNTKLIVIVLALTGMLLCACAPIDQSGKTNKSANSYNLNSSVDKNAGLTTDNDPIYINGPWPTDNPAQVSINGNLWDDMQDYLALPDYSYRPVVQAQIKWYQEHQGYLNHIIKESAPYIYYIYQQTRERNLPAELALLPMIESEYDPFAYSKAGATGLWQMMPGTASGFGLKIDWWYDGRRDVISSTNAALNYLAYLNDFFSNKWLLAVAAYDSGEGTVQNAVRQNKRRSLSANFWSLHLPYETKCYVPKLLALAAIIRDPDRYGIHLQPINNAPYLAKVNIGSQIDLNQAAKLAGISNDSIRKLNPGFRRWATDPNGPYTLLVPIDKAEGFSQRLDALPKSQRVTWREHTVKDGETLSEIALKYKTNSYIITQVNHLKSNTIRPSQQLLIPESFHGSLKSPVVIQHATIAEEKLPGPHRVLHIVKSGDTLWTVAEKYRVTVRQICFWNNFNLKKSLSSGNKLLIWAPSHKRTIDSHNYIYKVRSGDSLYLIATRFNSTAKMIRRENHLHNNILHVGQIINIPGNDRYYYTVQEGDTISVIAQQFESSAHLISQANNLHNNLLQVGQVLRIPKNRAPTTNGHNTTNKYRHIQHIHYVHTVEPGDSLKKIAQEFKVTTKQLTEMNPKLASAKYIHAGEKIYINK